MVDVRLVGFPLRVWQVATEHHEELRREFALLMLSSTHSDVPRRLIELIEDITVRFAGATESGDVERDAALARGEESVDLTFRVPAAGRDASIALGRMLDEADDFCRAGDQLLTLATPESALAFRRWYLSEFVRQIDGLPARPWPGVEQAIGIPVESAAG